MLTPKEENLLLQNLPIQTQCKSKEAEFLKFVYAIKLCHVNYRFSRSLFFFISIIIFQLIKPNKQCITYEQHQQSQSIFKENLDILTSKAERLYYNGDFDSAYQICRKYY